jgi:hypothetical protein
VAAHRYWRIWIQATHYGAYPGFYACLAEVQLLDAGSVNRIGSGTASISGSSDGSHLAAQAIDGNASTFWNGQQNGPWWWAYDFGSGNAFDIRNFSLTSRADIGDTSPYDFFLQYSDDGSHWTTTDYNRSQTFTAGQTRTFSVTQVSGTTGNTHRYWRLNITHDVYGPDAYVSIAELGLCQRSDGANVVGAATLTASSSLFSTSQAVDDNVGTYWSPGAIAACTFQADFGATPRDISKITIYSRTDVPATGPSAFSCEYSDDAISWRSTDSYTPGTWASTLLYQEFTVSPSLAPVVPTPTTGLQPALRAAQGRQAAQLEQDELQHELAHLWLVEDRTEFGTAITGIRVSKALDYVVLSPPAGLDVSKALAYAVVAPPRGTAISKFTQYVILQTAAQVTPFAAPPAMLAWLDRQQQALAEIEEAENTAALWFLLRRRRMRTAPPQGAAGSVAAAGFFFG